MTRLLVVSHSAILVQRLRDVHEVIEHPVDHTDDLSGEPAGDVLVLDLKTPDAALRMLESLRARGSRAPALIVAGHQPAWADLAARTLPGVLVVPLPVTREALLGGIERLSQTPTSPRPATDARPDAGRPAGRTSPGAAATVPPPLPDDRFADNPLHDPWMEDIPTLVVRPVAGPDPLPAPITGDIPPAVPAHAAPAERGDPSPVRSARNGTEHLSADTALSDPDQRTATTAAAEPEDVTDIVEPEEPEDWVEPSIERPGWVQPGWALPADHATAPPVRAVSAAPDPSVPPPPMPPGSGAQEQPLPGPQTPSGHRRNVPVVDSVLLPVHVDPAETLPKTPYGPTADDLFPSPAHPSGPHDVPLPGGSSRAVPQTSPAGPPAPPPTELPPPPAGWPPPPPARTVPNDAGTALSGLYSRPRQGQAPPESTSVVRLPPAPTPAAPAADPVNSHPVTFADDHSRATPPGSSGSWAPPPPPWPTSQNRGEQRPAAPNPLPRTSSWDRFQQPPPSDPQPRHQRNPEHQPPDLPHPADPMLTKSAGPAPMPWGQPQSYPPSARDEPGNETTRRRSLSPRWWLGGRKSSSPEPVATPPEPTAFAPGQSPPDPQSSVPPGFPYPPPLFPVPPRQSSLDALSPTPLAPVPPPAQQARDVLPWGERPPDLPARADQLVTIGEPPGLPNPDTGDQAARHPHHTENLHNLVSALTTRSAELFGVSDTAQVLAEDLVERAEADAAAVLVPDGSTWRVSGSVGLNLLEQRATLDTTHWLVTEIAQSGQVLLLQNTPPARSELASAPLASWPHLLAVPVPQVNSLIMLARGPAGRAFTKSDLSGLTGPISEATTLLATALQTRKLARLLAPFTETESPNPV